MVIFSVTARDGVEHCNFTYCAYHPKYNLVNKAIHPIYHLSPWHFHHVPYLITSLIFMDHSPRYGRPVAITGGLWQAGILGEGLWQGVVNGQTLLPQTCDMMTADFRWTFKGHISESNNQSINQSIYLTIYLTINLSIYQSIYVSIVSMDTCIHACIYLSIYT